MFLHFLIRSYTRIKTHSVPEEMLRLQLNISLRMLCVCVYVCVRACVRACVHARARTRVSLVCLCLYIMCACTRALESIVAVSSAD